MTSREEQAKQAWTQFIKSILPFADVATPELPLKRLLRLSLFQVSVGMAVVLLNGTLNRVMVVEMHVPAWLVASMISLPLIFAPLRALIGHRSDYHQSAFGLRRVPYIWLGTLLQFGGFSIMPFALIVLADVDNAWQFLGHITSALVFLLVGAGLHTTQTAGLALATDLAPEHMRPRVVALLYVTLLVGMMGTALLFGFLLSDFSADKLVQVIQAAAVATVALNVIALWKQEAIDMKRANEPPPRPRFSEAWRALMADPISGRLLIAVGLGTAAFTMQDILLEPYGGQILHLSVSQTTALTAIWAAGTLAAFALAAYMVGRGADSLRLAASGVLVGVVAFAAVILAASTQSTWIFRSGAGLIGFGGGLFAVGTLIAAMGLARGGHSGLALGAWGSVQATAAGVAIALGGALRDTVAALGDNGVFGAGIHGPTLGYTFVYSLEIVLLLATAPVILPLALRRSVQSGPSAGPLGLDQLP